MFAVSPLFALVVVCVYVFLGREQTYEHLNRRLPPHLKYDLHVLLVGHGKTCAACTSAAKGKPNNRAKAGALGPCPLRPVGMPAKIPDGMPVSKALAAPRSALSADDSNQRSGPETPAKKPKR